MFLVRTTRFAIESHPTALGVRHNILICAPLTRKNSAPMRQLRDGIIKDSAREARAPEQTNGV